MRIAVDARSVFSPNRRGTGKNLIDVYRMLAAQRPNWQFLMFGERRETDDPFTGLPNVRRRLIDAPGYRFNVWQDVLLPTAARACRATVLHCPANTAPIKPFSPLVLTIHDLIPVDIAPDAPETARWFRRVKRSARLAKRIIVPSHYTEARIVDALGVRSDKIRVNYWAPDRACRRVEAPAVLANTRSKYEVQTNQPYILAFGAADPRKNTTAIIEAWARVPQALRDRAVLLVVGLQDEALTSARTMAEGLMPDRSWRLHGFVPEEDVAPLLSAATALCFPSRSEGFGLPVLDAFACDTPVITSATTSLREVAGEAALLVDPNSVDEISAAMQSVLSSRDICARLRAAGRQRLAAFSWERCATTLGDALEGAAAA